MRMRRSLLLALALLLVPAASAPAFSMKVFKTPSGTSLCGFFSLDNGSKYLRCDVYGATNRPPKRPKSCEFDYGFSFGLESRGRSYRNCVSDAIADPRKTRVLAYGRAMTRFGMTCRSRATGLTCTNRSGHGFTLRRDRQKLF